MKISVNLSSISLIVSVAAIAISAASLFVSNRHFQTSNRPQLIVDFVPYADTTMFDLFYEDRLPVLEYQITVKNVGSLTANNITIFAESEYDFSGSKPGDMSIAPLDDENLNIRVRHRRHDEIPGILNQGLLFKQTYSYKSDISPRIIYQTIIEFHISDKNVVMKDCRYKKVREKRVDL